MPWFAEICTYFCLDFTGWSCPFLELFVCVFLFQKYPLHIEINYILLLTELKEDIPLFFIISFFICSFQCSSLKLCSMFKIVFNISARVPCTMNPPWQPALNTFSTLPFLWLDGFCSFVDLLIITLFRH